MLFGGTGGHDDALQAPALQRLAKLLARVFPHPDLPDIDVAGGGAVYRSIQFGRRERSRWSGGQRTKRSATTEWSVHTPLMVSSVEKRGSHMGNAPAGARGPDMRIFLLLLILAGGIAGAAPTPRIAVGGIMHESNSFYPVPTRLKDFQVFRGTQIAAQYAASQSEMAGYLEGAKRYGFEVYPTLFASATPAGPVTAEALDSLTAELIGMLKSAPKLDGVLLALHGAMVSESHPHADAETVRRVRAAVGLEMPIVVTHDFHANIPPSIVHDSNALVTYKTNPHVDQRERGVKAAEIAARIARGEAKPTQAIAKPPMIYNIRFQNTNMEPLGPVTEESRRLECDPHILAASVAGGYQYADVPEVGPSAIVVTNDDAELAARQAARLSDMLWATRDRLTLDLPDPAEAVRQACASDRFPVVLVEMGDNIGGGSAGDATFILASWLTRKLPAGSWPWPIHKLPGQPRARASERRSTRLLAARPIGCTVPRCGSGPRQVPP